MATNSSRQVTWAGLAAVGLTVALMLAAVPAQAQQIDLGGTKPGSSDSVAKPPGHAGAKALPQPLPRNELKWRPRADVVELPTIITPVEMDSSHRMRFVHISAYLAPTDSRLASQMNTDRDKIAELAKHELPNRAYADLLSPYRGPVQAKEAIHLAVEQSLGRPWAGEVYIRSLMVY